MTVNLIDLAKPLEDVRFPNGSVHVPVPFGPAEYALWRELTKTTDPALASQCGMQIIRACYPTVTDDDLLDCDGEMLLVLAAHPGRKIEQVKTALKNVGAAAQPEPPPTTSEPPATTVPLSPKTSGSTSSSRSRKRSGKTGGPSTSASPTADPNSSGSASTTSKSLGASTPCAVNWTTSTAPV